MLSIIRIILITIIFKLTFNGVSYSKVEMVLSINNEIITNFDIYKEVEYLKLLNPQLEKLNKKRIYELSKTTLTNELIKKKEISKFPNNNKDNNQFINEQINELIKKLNFKDRETFIKELKKRKTYSIKEIENKINIELNWNEIIFKKYNSQVNINLKKIKENIKKTNNEQKSFLLSEIVFNLEKSENFDDKFEELNSSIKEVGFGNSATIYSISESAKFGGKIDWINQRSLSNEIYEVVSKLKIGEISKPIKIANNFLLLKLENFKIENNPVNEQDETERLVILERNKQLNQFSKIYFDKSKINYVISEYK